MQDAAQYTLDEDSADGTRLVLSGKLTLANIAPLERGLKRLSRPEDVAPMVCLLASDRAAYITGQSIGISGGFYML